MKADKNLSPTDENFEKSKGRIALWLDKQDLEWLANHCCCSNEASQEELDRCLRIRFRSKAALHKNVQ